jgi:ferrous iron transport protein B
MNPLGTPPSGLGTLPATVALLGNPNTGKTTLFNALAGMRQRVGNYPGVTVETKKGRMHWQDQALDLVDLPGTYSLAARSPDEMLAVDLILGQQQGEPRPEVILVIVDASNLERNLYLATQAMELGVPVVIGLNMVDVAVQHGIQIDADKLARQLGVRVIPIQANKRKGLEQLKEALLAATVDVAPTPGVCFPEALDQEVQTLHETLLVAEPLFLIRRLLLDAGGYLEQRLTKSSASLLASLRAARERLAAAGCSGPAVEANARYRWIREITRGCIQRPRQRPVTWTDRIDRILTHRVWGTLVFLVVMFLIFQSIFTFATPLMKGISAGKDWLGETLQLAFQAGPLKSGPLASLIVDGILKGVGSVVVFLPQILILFGFIAILEDCGYMARAAFLMDKLMSRCGLSGKSFIPMLSSVACAVPGIMATRVIENRRDRLATIMVAPLMSCSARLPVYTLLIGAFLTRNHPWWVPGLTMFAMYAIGLIVAPLVALVLKGTLLRGETPAFVMEMPLYKWPSWRTILSRMFDSGWAFLRRAGTLILASMILVWALLYFPQTDEAGRAFEPRIDELREQRDQLLKSETEENLAKAEESQHEIDELYGEWKRQSYLGKMGRAIEPAVRPLGWDWRIGMAALASFPAREVVIGTLGIIYNEGEIDSDSILKAPNVADTGLAKAVQGEMSVPTALSIMVFFALCCQCASTLAVIRRETNSWRWPAFTFVYMTALAYLGALLVYQVGCLV